MNTLQLTSHPSTKADSQRHDYHTFFRLYMARNATLIRLLAEVLRDTSTIAQDVVSNAVLQGRVKSASSAWLKALRLHDRSVVDSLGVRVIVATTEDCYRIHKHLVSRFDTIPGADDDYILNPKPNGYRSLHTTTVFPGGYTVEMQIRTASMHAVAETGTASHRHYKALTNRLAVRNAHPSKLLQSDRTFSF